MLQLSTKHLALFAKIEKISNSCKCKVNICNRIEVDSFIKEFYGGCYDSELNEISLREYDFFVKRLTVLDKETTKEQIDNSIVHIFCHEAGHALQHKNDRFYKLFNKTVYNKIVKRANEEDCQEVYDCLLEINAELFAREFSKNNKIWFNGIEEYSNEYLEIPYNNINVVLEYAGFKKKDIVKIIKAFEEDSIKMYKEFFQ